jgi:hypothetical protein
MTFPIPLTFAILPGVVRIKFMFKDNKGNRCIKGRFFYTEGGARPKEGGSKCRPHPNTSLPGPEELIFSPTEVKFNVSSPTGKSGYRILQPVKVYHIDDFVDDVRGLASFYCRYG